MRFTVTEDGTTHTYLAHHEDGSWARLHKHYDWLVELGGHRSLWDQLEAVHEGWIVTALH